MPVTEHRCPPDHKHEATATCYVTHKCRCAACRTANTERQRQRRKLVAYGRYVPPDVVDAEPVRAHVRTISEYGIGLNRLAEVTGVSRSTLTGLMHGVGKGRRDQVQRHIRRTTAETLLAVRPDLSLMADEAVIPARGARRRLQALIRLGWSQRRLARHLEMSYGQLGFILHDTPGITVRMHHRIDGLFADLWDKIPPHQSTGDLSAYNRSVNYAKARGWHPPLAWDDIDLDDGPATVDRVPDDDAVNRAIDGDDVTLTPQQRRTAVETLHRYGLNDQEIAARLHCSDRTVLRIRHSELGLTANAHPRAA
jgi:hypothetical protein